MAIAFDATSHGLSSTVTNTVAHTTSGTNRGLVAFIVGNDTSTDDVTSVTYAGVAMVRIDGALSITVGSRWIYTYYLSNPTIGTNNIVVTITSAQDEQWLIAGSYTGVNQSNTPDGHAIDIGPTTASTYSPPVTTTAAGAWVMTTADAGSAAVGYTSGTNTIVRFDYTAISNETFADSNGAVLTPGTNSVNMVRISGSTQNAGRTIALAPAATTVNSGFFFATR